MADPAYGKAGDLAPLSQAGIPKADIDRQLEKLCHSEAFEGRTSEKKLLRYLVRESLEGNLDLLTQSQIAKAVFKKSNSDSRTRKAAGRLRDFLSDYYGSSEAKPDEIRFSLPERRYVVHAPRASTARVPPPKAKDGRILAPVDKTDVYQRVTVRGRTDNVDLDLRLWLIVRTPVGALYPQCLVTRNSATWEAEVRIGLVTLGADEGAIYEILLVAADRDGDIALELCRRTPEGSYGPTLPTDCRVLDSKQVTRRDFRPNDGAQASAHWPAALPRLRK
jgi:hypothetical protein